MKVIIFCGGLGMRLREYSETTPKPMIPIGYRPKYDETVSNNLVMSEGEKKIDLLASDINGGFFVMRQEVFDWIGPGEELVQGPFKRLAAAGKGTAEVFNNNERPG